MHYLAKGGFWLGVGQIFSSISTFLLAVVFANSIAQDAYGIYKYILSITGILMVLSLRGIDHAVLQAVTRGFEGVLIPGLKTRIRWGILSTLGSLGISIYYYTHGNINFAFLFLIASIFLPFFESFGLYHAFLDGKKMFKQSVVSRTATQIVCALILTVCLFFTKNLFIILFTYFGSWTVCNIFFFVFTIKKNPPNQQNDAATIPYGKHISAVNILDALVTSIDGLLIFQYLGPVKLAVYTFALAPVSQIRSLFSKIPTLIIPKLSMRSATEIDTVLKKRIFILFIIGLLFSVSYSLMAPIFFKLFFPAYFDSIFSSQLFSLSIALALPQTLFGAAIGAKLTLIPKKMIYIANVPGIVFIVSLFMFIGSLGINGVILSRLISLTSGLITNHIMWEKIKIMETKS